MMDLQKVFHISNETMRIFGVEPLFGSCVFYFVCFVFSWCLMVGLGPGGLDSWDSPYERDCYLTAPLESQTTGPQTNN